MNALLNATQNMMDAGSLLVWLLLAVLLALALGMTVRAYRQHQEDEAYDDLRASVDRAHTSLLLKGGVR